MQSSGPPKDQASRLERLDGLCILDTPPEQLFSDLACLAAVICDTPVGLISFIDQQREWFKATVGTQIDEVPLNQSFGAHAISQSEVFTVLDPLSDERFANTFLVTDLAIRFYAGAPLVVDGHAVGTVAVMDSLPHLPTSQQIESLQILARQALAQLELRRLRNTHTSEDRKRKLYVARPQSSAILLVEEDENLRILIKRSLEDRGFSVLTAADAIQGLKICRQHDGPVGLVIGDVVALMFGGNQVAGQLRSISPDTKFLFLSSDEATPLQLGEITEKGGNTLEKPFLPADLVRKVEEMLNENNAATGTEG